MKKIIFVLTVLLITGCDNSPTTSSDDSSCGCGASSNNTSWMFVANEGNFSDPSDDGVVSMIDDQGNVYESPVLGKIVQSIEVYNNKLIASINVSEKLAILDISKTGLSNLVEVDLSGTPPREIAVVNGKAYVSCWGDSNWEVYPTVPGYVKVVDLESLEVESSIEVGIMPEGLLYESNVLWVANSGGSTLSKIDVGSNSVLETIEVGEGPQSLEVYNEDVYVSRRYYDESWNEFHGSSKISGGSVVVKDYASGIVCGGSVLKYNDAVYRSYSGGIYPLDSELNLESAGRIGQYEKSPYHVEVINDWLWFGIRGDVDSNYIEGNGSVKVLDSGGVERYSYGVGIAPGDFAYWSIY